MRFLVLNLTVMLCLSAFNSAVAQCFISQRIHKITANVSPAIQSYLEYKPAGFDTSSKPFPLIVYLGGTGEMFQQPGGTDQDLCPVLNYSLPWRLNTGQVPETVFDNQGRQFSFFVLMPFVTQWGQQYSVDPGAMIDFALKRYPNKIDTNRIYLTAMSRGTDNIMGYATSSPTAAKRITAMVPVANCFPANVGTPTYTQQVNNLASGTLHIWGISCQGDRLCSEMYIKNWISSLDSLKPGYGIFSYSTFSCDTSGPNPSFHYAWNQAYDAEYRVAPGKKNVYEWMIQFSRDTNNVGTPPPPPPPPTGTPDCNKIVITVSGSNISLKGLLAPVSAVQIFDNSWATVYNQAFTNYRDTLTTPPLPNGTYHVKISFYTSAWTSICEKVQDAIIGGTTPPPPPPPPPPPTGTPDCNNIKMYSLPGAITFKGLVAPVVTVQIFNSAWTSVYNQGFTNSPDTLAVLSLPAGTYHVKVNFNNASWVGICEKLQDAAVTAPAIRAAAGAYATELSARVIESNATSIAVAPNPFDNAVQVTIGAPKNENASLVIVDLAGRIVMKRSVTLQPGLNRFSLDNLSTYRPGSYFLRVVTSAGVQNLRLLRR